MNEQETFLFDLQGYLVVPDALGAEQLRALNRLMDERIATEADAAMHTHRFGATLEWGRAVRDLLDNPRITPYLEALLGPQFRLDHEYADVIRAVKGADRDDSPRRCDALRSLAVLPLSQWSYVQRLDRGRLQPQGC